MISQKITYNDNFLGDVYGFTNSTFSSNIVLQLEPGTQYIQVIESYCDVTNTQTLEGGYAEAHLRVFADISTTTPICTMKSLSAPHQRMDIVIEGLADGGGSLSYWCGYAYILFDKEGYLQIPSGTATLNVSPDFDEFFDPTNFGSFLIHIRCFSDIINSGNPIYDNSQKHKFNFKQYF